MDLTDPAGPQDCDAEHFHSPSCCFYALAPLARGRYLPNGPARIPCPETFKAVRPDAVNRRRRPRSTGRS
jgi:hypothetical protein